VNLTVINPDASSGGLSKGYSYVAPTGLAPASASPTAAWSTHGTPPVPVP
jgi:hypothetical protein